MRKTLVILAFLLCAASAAFSQSGGNTRYIAVKNTVLKNSTGFFAKDTAALTLGEEVTLIKEDGKWAQIRAKNLTGYVASASLSSRRVVSSASAASINEVALAGKGFSPDMEIEYRKSGLDYSAVDAMEKLTVPSVELLGFINEGRLVKGE